MPALRLPALKNTVHTAVHKKQKMPHRMETVRGKQRSSRNDALADPIANRGKSGKKGTFVKCL